MHKKTIQYIARSLPFHRIKYLRHFFMAQLKLIAIKRSTHRDYITPRFLSLTHSVELIILSFLLHDYQEKKIKINQKLRARSIKKYIYKNYGSGIVDLYFE